MNRSLKKRKKSGQALIELVVILPVFLLFLATVLPIVASGVTLPLLDERLTFRHLGEEGENTHQLLQTTHDPDFLPPYFDKAKLQETTEIIHIGVPLPLVNSIFSGDMTRKLTIATMPDHGWWNQNFLGLPQERNQKLSRDLSLVTAQVLTESKVPDEVKKLTPIGIVSGMANTLERAGLNLFHLNLDALPESSGKKEKE